MFRNILDEEMHWFPRRYAQRWLCVFDLVPLLAVRGAHIPFAVTCTIDR